MKRRATLAALVCLLATPAAAQAVTLSAQGAGDGQITLNGDPVAAETIVVTANTVDPGSDTATFFSAGDTVEIDADDQDICSGDGTDTATCTVEDLAILDVSPNFGDDSVEMNGNFSANVFGGEGVDSLTGSEDAGDDLTGGPGDDIIVGRAGSDEIVGGSGADNADGGAGEDFFDDNGADGVDTYQGGPGRDGILYVDGDPPPDTPFAIDLTAATGGIAGGAETDSLAGIEDGQLFDAGPSSLIGSAGRNFLAGDERADFLDGRGGPDELRAHGGDDSVEARDGANDRIDCGFGVDSAQVDQFDQTIDCESVTVTETRAENADLIAPACTVTGVKRTYARAAFFKGFRPAVTCSEPATLEIRLVATVKRGNVVTSRVGDIVLAEATALPGAAAPRIKAAKRFARQLSKKRGFRTRLVIEAGDEFGNSALTSRTVKVKKAKTKKRRKRR